MKVEISNDTDYKYYCTRMEIEHDGHTIWVTLGCETDWTPSDRELGDMTREEFSKFTPADYEYDCVVDPGGHFERQATWLMAKKIKELLEAQDEQRK